MTSDRSDYQPINCEFHDLLEDLATTRKPARISFLDEHGVVQHRDAVIADVFAKQGAEYLATAAGETLRLDRLLEVDAARLADFEKPSE
ncbi:hypothetical protein ACFQ4Q_10320 [Lysobacter gummosus]|jgi:Rho-binding antiterminator|uniref:hypothetical protein n=1 Tax=Lysobacter gummosus TaxID=262324 RepID=UPI003626FF57